MACSPVGLISSMDRALRRLGFDSLTSLNFSGSFQPLRLFIQLRRSCSLSYLDLQFKNVIHFLYIYFSVRRVVASMKKEVEIMTSNCD